MAHTAKCEYSQAPARSCRCSCGGEEHGKGSAQHATELRTRAQSHEADAAKTEREGDERGAQVRRARAQEVRNAADRIDADRHEHEAAREQGRQPSGAIAPYGDGGEQDEAVNRAHSDLGSNSGRVTYAERDPRTGAVTVETADDGPSRAVTVTRDGRTLPGRANLAAPSADPDGAIRVGAVAVHPAERSVTVNGREVPSLSHREQALVQTLAEQPDRVFTKEELMVEVWGARSTGSTRMLDSHAARLRMKLQAAGAGDGFVQNVWGQGYRFRSST